jgi:hypothetical protein
MLHKSWAQIDIIVNVVNAEGECAEANLNRVRLKLHPGGMRWRDSNRKVRHRGAAEMLL